MKKAVFLSMLLLGAFGIYIINLEVDFFNAMLQYQTKITASLFGGGDEAANEVPTDVYIPGDFVAIAGENGEVSLRSAGNWENVLGLSFSISWDASKATFTDVLTLGTVFESEGFFVDKNVNQSEGTLNVALVKGSNGVQVQENNDLLSIGFALSADLIVNDVVDISIHTAEIAYEDTATQTLLSENISSEGGAITVQNVSISAMPLALPQVTATISSSAQKANSVALKAPQALSEIVGMSFVMEWNKNEATFLNVSLDGTALEGSNFLVEHFLENPGVLRGALASSGSGVNTENNQSLINIAVEISDTLAVGSIVDFLFRDVEVILSDLSVQTLENQSVSLTVSTRGTLQLLQTRTLSPTSLELEFSDFIRTASIGDVIISPNIVNASSTLVRDNKKIILENLDPQTSQRLYRVDVLPTLRSNSEGTIDPEFSTGFMSGFPNGSFDPWDFSVESAQVLSGDTVEVMFSESIADEITPLNVDMLYDADGVTRRLTVVNTKTQGRKLTLHTALQDEGEQYVFLARRNQFKNISETPLNKMNNIAFFGFEEMLPQITSLTPTSVMNDVDTDVTISGVYLPLDISEIKVGGTSVNIVGSSTNTEIIFTLPAQFISGSHEVQIFTLHGDIITASQNLVVSDPALAIRVLSKESYASPEQVEPNQTTTLWTVVEDPRGVSDIEKVTADLREFEGSPTAEFTPDKIVNLQRWYSLDLTIPSSIRIKEGVPYIIPVTAENKSGETAKGTVSLFVVRDATGNNPPEIISAASSKPNVAPGSDTTFRFTVQVRDADGANDIRRVVIDATQIGLHPLSLTPLESGDGGPFPTKICTESDYVLGEYGECVNGEQIRSVQKKSGVDCRDDAIIHEALERRSCTTAFLENFQNMLFSKAYAQTVPGVSTRFFLSDELTLPVDVVQGTYDLPVIVTDRQGSEVTGILSFAAVRTSGGGGGSPRIDDKDITFSPSKSMKRDGKTVYTITIKVTDANGGDNVESVVADLSPLKLPPTPMGKVATVGDTVFFSTEFVVPETAFIGFNTMEFVASDAQGNTTSENVTIEVVKANEDPNGRDPEVYSERGYMTPKFAMNDGLTRFSTFVFVQDRDGFDDISHVTLELGNIAHFFGKTSYQFNPYENVNGEGEDDNPPKVFSLIPQAIAQEESESISEKCVTTPTLVCMFPSITEGDAGRWWYVPDLVIPPTTPVPPSGEPYLLRVVATDHSGRSGEGIVKIAVTEPRSFVSTQHEPFLTSAVATDTREVQALFSTPIERKKIVSSAFKIVGKNNVLEVLPIQGVSMSSDGKSVTLRTNFMLPVPYTLIVDTEKLGVERISFSGDRIDFEGYSREIAENADEPSALVAKSRNGNTVEISFDNPLLPSELHAAEFKVYERANTNKSLEIKKVSLGSNGTLVTLLTSAQKTGIEYTVHIQNVKSVYKKVLKSKKLNFIGSKMSSDQFVRLWNQADLDRNGKIDFSDFTLFSAVYGSEQENSPGDLNGDGLINFSDFTAFAGLYGTLPPPPPVSEKTQESGKIIGS